MTSRLAAASALAVVLAAGIAFVSGQRNVQAQPSAPKGPAATVPSPPGVNPARWFPLGATSGVALHPESQATSPDTVLSGDLWVIVNDQWHVVQLSTTPLSSPSTVPAVSVIPFSALPPAA